jgi:subtilase family serine protease
MKKKTFPLPKIFIFFSSFIFLLALFITFNIKIQTQAATQPKQKTFKNIVKRKFHRLCDLPQKGTAGCHAHFTTDDAGKPLVGSAPSQGSYGPSEFHLGYNLPCTPGGLPQAICSQPAPQNFSNQTIAIVDAYQAPTIENDLAVYSQYYGLPSCTRSNGCLRIVNQNGATSPLPGVNSGWALEASLDVEVAHAICQTCKILLVETNSNSIVDLGIGVNKAAALGATSISNSYGASEALIGSSETSFDTYYNHPGIAVTASSGDSGYGAEFPAASPNVVAVGGTTLKLFTDDSYATETVWSYTGSGCSAFESANPWQTNLPTPCGINRAITDVSADADPSTGAAVYDSTLYSGKRGWWQLGGTSLASPIIAATYALAGGVPANTNAASLPYAYFSAANSHDITSGSNGSCSISIMCNAGVGYDGPTGLGTPYGISGFTNSTANISGTPTPTNTPSPTPTPTNTPTPTSIPIPTSTPTPTSTDTIPPAISITSPLNGSTVRRKTNITVAATATDNVAVTKVLFYRNNALICTDAGPTIDNKYSCSMYTGNAGNKVTYKATAFDAAGNSTPASVTVTAK